MSTTIDKSKLEPEHRTVLDWLCRQPARVFDFSEVADAIGVKRSLVESAIMALRNPRLGGHLSGIGPDALPLRERYAFLPAHAPIRKEFPPLKHPPALEQKLYVEPLKEARAMKKSQSEQRAEAKAMAREEAAKLRQRERDIRRQEHVNIEAAAKRDAEERSTRVARHEAAMLAAMRDAPAEAAELISDTGPPVEPPKPIEEPIVVSSGRGKGNRNG